MIEILIGFLLLTLVAILVILLRISYFVGKLFDRKKSVFPHLGDYGSGFERSQQDGTQYLPLLTHDIAVSKNSEQRRIALSDAVSTLRRSISRGKK